MIDAHVVFLVNFLSPNLLEVFREVQKGTQRLSILVSAASESNRQWRPEYGELPVTVQKTWTRHRQVKHPGGYLEEQFIHFSYDTLSLLRQLRPDCLVSLEMGSRTFFANLYRRWNRRCRHVVSVYGSERSEAGRGRIRQWLRKYLISTADVVTYNGPSCLRYLQSLETRQNIFLPWNYAADPNKPYRGEILEASPDAIKLLTVGQLIERKGVLLGAEALRRWASANSQRKVHWTLVGNGPLQQRILDLPLPENLTIEWKGHCDADQLRSLYRDYPFFFFPTLGDEWGLVVDEAMASGQLVLGSIYSQAVEVLIRADQNGLRIDPEKPETMLAAFDRISTLNLEELQSIRAEARRSMLERTHVESAQQFLEAVMKALGTT